jgi:pseudouridine-5'-phosphate glycosidase
MARPKDRPVAKAGVRDLAPLLAGGRDAGTTVGATVFAAARAGIRLCATGGIGGVHRDAPFDVSSDLRTLAEHPVAVVSAGAKAILDLPATLETLETLGVPVIGLGIGEFPAFYTNASGLPLEHVAADAHAAARMLSVHWNALDQRSGVLLANAVPAASALPRDRVEEAIGAALAEAAARGVRGKAVTPFLLARLAADPALDAVRTNLAVLEANAAAAARVAVALAEAA